MEDRARELARDMEVVNRALESSRIHLVALARAADALELRGPINSPLLTLVEHAEETAARVTRNLRALSPTHSPTAGVGEQGRS
ncbi:hypothetical protein GA0070216_12719 [Micromonospora matsumotoense]|uniref:Histidine kinase n=1 Tax=Micromonospora matsumotoense TaxID=121616 RepID=A0A1C5ATJ7_9ACTN|nr:hypothetical protein [Micromonospora matsumotoense]SCF48483.1 hypothetical protein GA0070216_12719 [Micromonospora matsumotoense]